MFVQPLLSVFLVACWCCCPCTKPVQPCPMPVVISHCPCPTVGTYYHSYRHPYALVVHPPVAVQPQAKSLYERLGGAIAIKAVVDDFVARAAANPKVNFTRKGTPAEWKATPEAVNHLKKMLIDFVGSVTGGPQKYTGKNMKEAHKGMLIKADEFAALAADLKATLDKFNVPAKEQEEILKAVGGTAKDIIEEPKPGR